MTSHSPAPYAIEMSDGIVKREHVFDAAPFASCHAATLAEIPGGVAVAFFGGPKEGDPNVIVWLSRCVGGVWGSPEPVGSGKQPDGSRFACWNPVLFRPAGGPLTLFFKVGPSPSKWWGVVRTSGDDGRTWDEPRRLPDGILGPSKNKPVQLENGDVLSPGSSEDSGGWRVYFERSSDDGKTWTASAAVAQPAAIPKATQPTLLVHPGGAVQAICRTTVGKLAETWSRDAGRTWEPLRLMELPCPNSGVDAVTLRDGRHLLIYNHSNIEKIRYPLNVALSRDGRTWEAALQVEHAPPGQYSYPAIIQTSDGLVHAAYTHKRRTIAHVVIDPETLKPRPIDVFACPPPGSPTHRSDEFQ